MLFRGQRSAFIMEMPLYHLPNARTIGLLVWQRSLSFVSKAGTNILAMAVVVWALSVLPNGDVNTSYLIQLGKLLSPVGTWMGLDWRLTVALIASFPAKENAVAALGVLFGQRLGGGTDPNARDRLHARLRTGVPGGHDAIPPVRGHRGDHAPGNRFVEMAGAQRRHCCWSSRWGRRASSTGSQWWLDYEYARPTDRASWRPGRALDMRRAFRQSWARRRRYLRRCSSISGRLGLIRPVNGRVMPAAPAD